MTTPDASLPLRILDVLVADRVPLAASVIAQRCGSDAARIGRVLSSRMVGAGRVSRLKAAGASFWRYYVTDEQVAFHQGAASRPWSPRRPVKAAAPAVCIPIVADVVDLPRRIRFLRDLKTRPAFDGYAVLDAILADYTAALKIATRETGTQPGQRRGA